MDDVKTVVTTSFGPPEPGNLDGYYRSIEHLFDDTRKLRDLERRADIPGRVAIATFVFCLLPAFPYVVSKLVLNFMRPRLIHVSRLWFSLGSFWFWWIVLFLASLLLLIMRFALKGSKDENRERVLSPPQLRFAYCYGAVDEIAKYQTNRMPQHLETARAYLEALSSYLNLLESSYGRTILVGGNIMTDGERIYYHDVLATSPRLDVYPRPKWYKLDPSTERIVNSFQVFGLKLKDRLRDKKDLASIRSLLTELSSYLYSEIPEISEDTSTAQNKLEQYGTESLLRFADSVNALPSYESEPAPLTTHEDVSRRVALTGSKILRLFMHQNILVAFVAWYLLTLCFFVGGFCLAFRLTGLKLDSVILVAIVGGPIATAITAATIPRIQQEKEKK